MAEIVIAVAGKVSEYLVAPIGRHLGYLFCYHNHVEKLRNEVQTLRAARNDQQITVDEATRKGDEIRPAVRGWLNVVDQITGEAEALALTRDDQNMSCLNGWCPNLISRYQLGREAYKKAQVIVEIQTAHNFSYGISYSVLPRRATFEGYECFQSRDSTLNQIMDALRDDKTKMIGVCGMGGLGKTMLVKQVAQQAIQHNLFTTYIFIDVSWTRDSKKDEKGIAKIQQKVAEMLGYQFKGKDESTRANELKQRLQKENQPEKEKEQKKEKILIILDDIWKEINLEAVGIPFKDDQTICKLVLVSRDVNLLCKDMGIQKCFQIQHLQGEEAWCLLKKIAGDYVEGDQLRPIAIKVLDECGGLPIAIVTIAKALKDENVVVWKYALDELRSCAPTNIRGMEENVYSCLEWSYNCLKGDEVKSLFLLCGCLSYCGDISMDQMLRYAMGLNFFDRIYSLEGAINKLVTLVKTLKSSSLLLDGAEDDGDGPGVGASRLLFMDGNHKSVRMHDLVRGVARIIASKDPYRFKVVEDVPFDQDWTEIEDESKFVFLYFKAVHELPPRLVCPKLLIFMLQSNSGASLNTMPNTFFEGINQLKVVALSGMHFPTLPSTLQSLANLRTLCLDRCKLGDMAIIGELKKLQVLSMVGSDIQQLPREMMQLTNLRLLDLNYCEKLKVIPRDILSSLSRLECLFMKSSFSEWAAEEVCDEDSNACLSELNNLHRLRTIEVKIPNVELVPKADIFGHNLTSYAIFVGSFDRLPEKYEKSRTLHLKGGDGSLLSRDGIRKLLRTTEEVVLWRLKVCGGPIPVRSFDNLKTLVVGKCHGLKFLFLLSMGRDLPQLEKMKIKQCNEMQQIMENGHVGIYLQLLFPKLRSLELDSLPKLVNFGYISYELETTSEAMCSQGNPDINMPFLNYQAAFPSLKDLDISNLDAVEKIWHNHESIANSFRELERVSIRSCQKLLNLIPSDVLSGLQSLQILKIVNCNSLEVIFDLEAIDSKEIHDIFVLQLRELCLVSLKNLKYVWNKAPQGLLSYQKLKSVKVSHCSSLKTPFPGFVVRSLLQVKDIDKNSRGVKEIVAHEDVAEAVTMFLFPAVTSLTNSCLNELECFYLGLDTLDWQRLKTLEVECCESLKMLTSKLDNRVEQPIFLCDKVSFPRLESLNLSLKLPEIQDLQVLFGALSFLKILIVENCPFLSSLFSPNFIPCLNNLKKLTVKECDLLEEVFDLRGLDHGGMLSNLEEVHLIGLPKLRHICYNSPPQVLFFQNLKLLQVKECDSLMYLFPPSMALGLVQLQDLCIENCSNMKDIITAEDRDFHNQLRLVSPFQNLKSVRVKQCDSLMYLFPPSMALGLEQLQGLYIEHCPNMKHIVTAEDRDFHNQPSLILPFQNLKFVQVKQCDSLMYLFPPSMALGIVQLQDLCVEDCPTMKYIVTVEDRDFHNQPRVVLPFQNLKSVKVKQCDSLMYLFSASQALCLVQLKHLCIENCSVIEEIVITEDGVTDEIIFPQITQLSLLSLPNLTSFCLRKQNLGVLFNEEVAFPKLEFLYITGLDNVKKIWHNQLLADSFSKLKEVKVENCNELQNVLTSKNWLPSLESLTIDSCGQFKEVFDLEVISVQKDVTDGRLRKLGSVDLQNLEHICNDADGKKLCVKNLKFLKVHNCESLEKLFSLYAKHEGINEINRQEGAEEIIDKINFPELRTLSLEFLPSLASFYPGRHTLRRLGQRDHDISAGVLFSEKVSFPNMEFLKLSRLPKLKEIWDNQLPVGSFCNLHIMEVEKCSSLLSVVPNNVIASFQNLKKLDVENCGQLQKVFDLGGLGHAAYENIGMLSRLEELKLIDLPNLTHICNEDYQKISCFENLKLLHVKQCGRLTHIFSSGLALGLVQLKDLCVEFCSMIKEIIGPEDVVENKIIFSGTTQLSLLELHNLTSFYVGAPHEIHTGDSDVLACLLFCDKVSFPNLEILKLSGLSKLTGIWNRQLQSGSFFNLQILEVEKCPFLLNVVPNNLIASLQNLEKLNVEKCDQLKEVFYIEGLYHEDARMLSKLKELKLIDLPQLRHIFCNNDFQQISCFQNLGVVQLKQCDSLRYLFSASMALGLVKLKDLRVENCSKIKEIIKEDKAVDIKFPQTTQLSLLSLPNLTSFYLTTLTPGMLFNDKVAFPSLVTLDISNLDNVEKIWHGDIIAGSFGKLKSLSVGYCQKLLNVISSNVVKRLRTLQNLKIVRCNALEEVFDLKSMDSKESHEIPVLQLQQLCLDNLKNLKCIWNMAFKGLLTYQNLKSVQVSYCPSLEIPFPGYVVRSLMQLKELDMDSHGMGKIVAHEDIAKSVTMFFFPGVESLTCAKKLARFHLGLDTLEWPMLKTLEVDSCESLEMLASKLDKSIENPIFLCDKVTFPKLEYLNLSLQLKDMQDLHVLFGALFNLKILIVENCPYLSSLFSPNFIRCLNNLKEVTVRECVQLEEVFDLIDHGDNKHVEMLSKLEEMRLIGLPKLRHICNNIPPQVLCFQNLKLLQVKKCDSVIYLFPPSMVSALVQLQDLYIEDCQTMEGIFSMAGSGSDNGPQVSCLENLKSLRVKQCHSWVYLFPYSLALGQLQELSIEHCSNLKKFIMDDRSPQGSSLQNLKFVRVKQCDILMYLFSASMALDLVQLHELSIEHCFDMKVILLEDRDKSNRPQQVSCFQNLKSVQVKQCDNLMFLFSSSFAVALVQLQELCIEHCSMIKEIVTTEEGVTDKIIFPQLTRVSLLKVPKLTSFYPSQNLEKIHMGDSNSAPGVLFNEKVAFPKMELLYVFGLCNVKQIWQNELLADSFSKLKEMKVENCNELQNILTSIVTDNQLSQEAIIRQEEGAKEVIDKIEFPKLTSLTLKSLPSLANFYPGSHTPRRVGLRDHDIPFTVLFNENVSFPSLKSLDISRLDSIKKIWHKKLIENSYGKHKQVKVENCGELQSGFPPNVLKQLRSLQILKIASCGQLEEVFDLEGADHIMEDATAAQLNCLVLQDLPQLQYIWNKDIYGILTFQKLDLVEVFGCNGLKSPFPVGCLVRDLPRLEKQLIRSRGTEGFGGKDEGEGFVFPKVTHDKPLDLQKIKGKEVMKVDDDVNEISEHMPGSSG